MRLIFKLELLGIIVAGNYLLHYNKFTYNCVRTIFISFVTTVAIVRERTTGRGIITSISRNYNF